MEFSADRLVSDFIEADKKEKRRLWGIICQYVDKFRDGQLETMAESSEYYGNALRRAVIERELARKLAKQSARQSQAVALVA